MSWLSSHSVPSPILPRIRVGIAVALPVLLGLVLAGLLVRDQLAAARERATSAVRAEVANTVTVVRSALRDQRTAAEASDGGGTLYPVAEIGRAHVSLDATVTARDSGTASLDDTAHPAAFIAPVYRGGAVPADTAGRRSAIVAYRVVPIVLQPTLDRLLPEVGGLTVHGPTRLVASDPRPAPPGSRRFGVDTQLSDAPDWAVEAWRPDPGVPGVAWIWAIGLVALFSAIGALLAGLLRRVAHADAEARLLQLDRSIVTGIAPLLQRSLDVGDVLPAVSAHLVDALGLAGLSLAVPGEDGERQLFVWGSPPDETVPPAAGRPEILAIGETFAITLSRAGRGLGVLRVKAGAPLGPHRLLSLVTAGDLLGSTLANADAYARQQELVDRLHSVDELKTIFLSTASHELRTPVAAIVGFTTLLLDQWDDLPPERSRPLVERVMANGRRLDALIEQLLDFSRVERGLPQTGQETIEIGATVARILDEQGEIATDHELVVDILGEALIRGSEIAIERILVNLVGNAAKYSPSGTRITVTVHGGGPRGELIVDDQGAGVPIADRERIFSRFFRGNDDAVARTRGAGIGLAIVSEYAAAMGATVSVDSAPGGGARFRVSIPTVELQPDPADQGSLDAALA